jgi:hypothetical protein
MIFSSHPASFAATVFCICDAGIGQAKLVDSNVTRLAPHRGSSGWNSTRQPRPIAGPGKAVATNLLTGGQYG